MYKLFLCLRYLLRRRIAVVPILAVMLCVAMDVIVASIMGGFLDEIKRSTRGLFGDVIVTESSYAGFGYYDTWIDAEGNVHPGLLQYLRELEVVEAATPEIETVAMLRLSRPERLGFTKPVQVRGIQADGYAKVTDFQKGLFYQNPELARRPEIVELYANTPAGRLVPVRELPPHDSAKVYRPDGRTLPSSEAVQDDEGRLVDKHGKPLRRVPFWRNKEGQLIDAQGNHVDENGVRIGPLRVPGFWSGAPDFYRLPAPDEGKAMRQLNPPGIDQPEKVGIIVGVRVLWPQPDKDGQYPRDMFQSGDEPIQLTMQPIYASGMMSQAPLMKQFYMIDTSHTRIPQIDQATVYVPFEQLQLYMSMEAGEEPVGDFRAPARTSRVLIRLRGDKLSKQQEKVGKDAVQEAVDRWKEDLAKHRDSLSEESRRAMSYYMPDFVRVLVWEEANKEYFSAIANQRFIALLMVGVVSLTAIALIWVIFLMIVVEKTKDIGIVKSVGGSSGGVALIFLVWAGIIGFIGSVLGGILGYLFIDNINGIERSLSKLLGTDLFDPQAYLFESIPARVAWNEVVIITMAAVLAAMIGALLPAFRAARMNPVESLRYE